MSKQVRDLLSSLASKFDPWHPHSGGREPIPTSFFLPTTCASWHETFLSLKKKVEFVVILQKQRISIDTEIPIMEWGSVCSLGRVSNCLSITYNTQCSIYVILYFSRNKGPKHPHVFSTETTFSQIFSTWSCLNLGGAELVHLVGSRYTVSYPHFQMTRFW